MMECSVIIPTLSEKRSGQLVRTLEALVVQETDRDFEVIVIDGSSCARITNSLRPFSKTEKLHLTYRENPNDQGPGHARNVGIELARGEILLFIDDDARPGLHLIEEHIKSHEDRYNLAVLGQVFESDERFYTIRETPTHGQYYDWRCFWTTNLSLRRKWVEEDKFDVSFGYGCEDLDLGYRLWKKGLSVLYNMRAKVFHDHPFTYEGWCERAYVLGGGAGMLCKKYPELVRYYEGHRLRRWMKNLVRDRLFNLSLRLQRSYNFDRGFKEEFEACQ